MHKELALEMLRQAPKQWDEYLRLIGLLSVTFARIERQVALITSLLINAEHSDVGDLLLDQLSFRQVLSHFEKLSQRLPTSLRSEATVLIPILKHLEHDRNDLIHGCATLQLGPNGTFSVEKVRHRNTSAKNPIARFVTVKGLTNVQKEAGHCLNGLIKIYKELIEL